MFSGWLCPPVEGENFLGEEEHDVTRDTDRRLHEDGVGDLPGVRPKEN